MKILHIDSSILGDVSVSRQLSAAIVAQLRAGRSDVEVTYRDVAADPLPHMSGEYFAATMAPDQAYSPELKAELETGAIVLDEFLAADIIVIGAGLYNFAVPSQLKAWLDRLVVAGKTFRFTPDGKSEGLVTGKRAILAVSRGGFYTGDSPMVSFEHTESHLRSALGFLGVPSEAITADGVATGPDQRTAAIRDAEARIATLNV
ncbi:TPA: NAD(P)H-dependent oxidoreductase [Yersinia enterocolitica]|nr:NAD(P)H-dependent oxidoreductase [Yersinia intermedia]HDL7808482.1 NAD(P)H-dependent oxidoreductase [Yersinia enterocolitica]